MEPYGSGAKLAYLRGDQCGVLHTVELATPAQRSAGTIWKQIKAKFDAEPTRPQHDFDSDRVQAP